MTQEKPEGLLKPPPQANNGVKGLLSITIEVQRVTKEGMAATAIMTMSLKPLQIIGGQWGTGVRCAN